jgi:signal peptidase I
MCIGNIFKPTTDVPSPRDIVPGDDIEYNATDKKVTIKNIEPDIWLTRVQDTNSMDPTVDAGHTCILTSHYQPENLAVGDVIVYECVTNNPILHRIVKIEQDSEGRKFTLKGDNNYRKDSCVVRDHHIKWLLIGIIY